MQDLLQILDFKPWTKPSAGEINRALIKIIRAEELGIATGERAAKKLSREMETAQRNN